MTTSARSRSGPSLLVLVLVASCGRFGFGDRPDLGDATVDTTADGTPGLCTGTTCDDGDPCTNPDVCVQGTCTGGPVGGGPASCSSSPRVIDRSVGVGSGVPLADSTGMLTIRGTTAIFSTALPDNVGIGDVIQYSTDGSATPNALALIHGRVSSTIFAVRSSTGMTPVETVASTGNWAVMRAYLSLAAAVNSTGTAPLAGSENPNIAAALRDFDAFTGGTDLVATNSQWNVACYAEGVDDLLVHINAPWVTDAAHYIRIFTPVLPSEVGVSQRHRAVLGTGYQRSHALHIHERSVWLDGISLTQNRQLGGATDPGFEFRVYIVHTGSQGSDVRISNCLGYMAYAASANRVFDIFDDYSPKGATSTSVKVWNSLGITDGSSGSAAFLANSPAAIRFTNCTAIATGPAAAFYNDDVAGSTATITNCLGYSATGAAFFKVTTAVPFTISDSAADDATISDTNVNATPGAMNHPSETYTFAGPAASDYHLSASGNTNIRAVGANYTTDSMLSFTTDIDGDPRPSTGNWDLGADQVP